MAQGFKGSNFAKKRRPEGDPVSEGVERPRFETLPPFTANSLLLPLEAVLPGVTAEAKSAGQIVFHALGDTGGVHGTETQMAIAEAMEAQITIAPDGEKPQFLYHLGDVVYFNGISTQYIEQFYEPYQYYNAPIFAIPGNHDGDTQVRKGDEPDNEPSLYGFMKNFCSPIPDRFFKYRSTMTQPYCYWTLVAPFVHVVGLYSNVDGLLDARGTTQQQGWLVDQLKNTPQNKWLIVAVHHPCFSLDSVHGGYEEILSTLDAAFDSAGRLPDAVLSGHVHNYQRYSRKLDQRSVPYIICGNGGYANNERALHKLQKGLENEQLPYATTREGISLEQYDTKNSGFLRMTVTSEELRIEYFSVSFDDPPIVSSEAADSIKLRAEGRPKAA